MNWRTLNDKEKMLEKQHLDTLTSVNNLTSMLRYQNKYEEVEQMNRRVLNDKEKMLKKKHLDTLTSVYYLTYLLQQQQRY